MALSDRVQKALEHIAAQDYENATIQASIAVDATAKREYGSKLSNGARFKRFIHEHQEFIYFVGLGCGPRLIFAGGHDGIIFGDRGALDRVLWKYVRNALLHEGDLGDNVSFSPELFVGHDERGRFVLSPHLLLGVLLTVVGSQVNAGQRLENDFTLEIAGHTVSLNSLWGRFDAICEAAGFDARSSS